MKTVLPHNVNTSWRPTEDFILLHNRNEIKWSGKTDSQISRKHWKKKREEKRKGEGGGGREKKFDGRRLCIKCKAMPSKKKKKHDIKL